VVWSSRTVWHYLQRAFSHPYGPLTLCSIVPFDGADGYTALHVARSRCVERSPTLLWNSQLSAKGSLLRVWP
jgi:hypothetical protein